MSKKFTKELVDDLVADFEEADKQSILLDEPDMETIDDLRMAINECIVYDDKDCKHLLEALEGEELKFHTIIVLTLFYEIVLLIFIFGFLKSL